MAVSNYSLNPSQAPVPNYQAPGGNFMNSWGSMNPDGPAPMPSMLFSPPVATGADMLNPLAAAGPRLIQQGQGMFSNIASGLRRFIPGMGQGSVDPNGQNGTGGSGTKTESDFGLNIPTAKLAIQGVETLGGLWAAFEQLGLSREMFNSQKQNADRNYVNSLKAYNSAVDDRGATRSAVYGDPTYAARYVAENKLPAPKKG